MTMIYHKTPLSRGNLTKLIAEHNTKTIVAPFEYLVPEKYIFSQSLNDFITQSEMGTISCHEFMLKNIRGLSYNNNSSIALVRHDQYFREASKEEAIEDFKKYGVDMANQNFEKIYGESLFKNKMRIHDGDGNNFPYYGPDRIIKSVFSMVIRPGVAPNYMTDLMTSVDMLSTEVSEVDLSLSACKEYLFYQIAEGRVKHLALHKSGLGYTLCDLKPLNTADPSKTIEISDEVKDSLWNNADPKITDN